MDFETVYRLSGLIPESSPYFSLYEEDTNNTSTNSEVNRFALCYKDLSFGWHFIKSYSDLQYDLPCEVIDEHNLVRAYNFERYDNRDIPLAQAIAIETSLPTNIKNTITSLFFSEGITIQAVAEITNFDEDTIRVYEELFFNVLDRKHEALFIAGLVYPETRAEELNPRYLQNVSNETLLRRVAYNNGTESTLALAGFKDTFLQFSDATSSTNKLESAIMSNAYFMAACGFLNSRDAPGIANAKNIMAAAKHGGGEEASFQETGFGAAPMGTIIINELMHAQKDEIAERLERTKMLQEAEVQKIRSLDGA